jgi:L-cysteate sulfo-lyase
MKLAEIRRVPLAFLPTPLELLPRLSDFLGGPRIYVKRDDQTGLALGGNKVRKLEFLLGDALQQGCDMLVTTGGQQSNHARQTAAAAAKLGLGCELVLPKLVPWSTPEYQRSGNVLLDHLLGARLDYPSPEESAVFIETRLQALVADGKRPYFIPTGGSTPVGALGYLVAAAELIEQARERQLAIHTIVVPTGSAGTHAGILAGLIAAGHSTKVQGFAVSGTARDKQQLVQTLSEQVLALLDQSTVSVADQVQVDDGFVGHGYGLPTDAMIEAVRMTAKLEGLLLDPVYTGKAMAGLFHAVRRGDFSSTDQVVFWHTGGTAALFAYPEIFEAHA